MSLFVTKKVFFDETLKRREFFTHHPYASTTYGDNDVIRIPVQHQDSVTVPCDSYLHINGRFVKSPSGGVTNSKLTRNALAFLFSEIKFELGGHEIAQTRNVGVTTTLKGYVSHTATELPSLANSGWTPLKVNERDGSFDACIPLSMLMGFFEDMRRVIVNMKQELILVRASSDENAYVSDATSPESSKFIISKITWNMPHLTVSDEQRLQLLKVVAGGKPLPMSFRSWELIEHPMVPQTTRHVWQVKSVPSMETPRFIILAFQTDRIGDATKDSSIFDHCTLRTATIFLNSEYYPHTPVFSDFDSNEFAQLYHSYSLFPPSYYGCSTRFIPMLSPTEFKELAPIVVIDTSAQNETVKPSAIDVRVEYTSKTNFPENTTAYCLVIYDRVVEYTPLTSLVNRVV